MIDHDEPGRPQRGLPQFAADSERGLHQDRLGQAFALQLRSRLQHPRI
jgi:hypothetical protein